ncbi:MAG TPA: hypothetical protein VLE03_06050 [Nitrospiraceae bacterium]|nr:hypothetical protein [Nitrospiraceae bacterium]
MATAFRTATVDLQSQTEHVGAHHWSCARCGGLMVSDFCMDLLNSTGELEFAARRCVQCGEVVDPVIQRNRRLRQESMAVRFAGQSLSTSRVTEVR